MRLKDLIEKVLTSREKDAEISYLTLLSTVETIADVDDCYKEEVSELLSQAPWTMSFEYIESIVKQMQSIRERFQKTHGIEEYDKMCSEDNFELLD